MKIATKHKLIKRKSKTHMLFKKVSSFRLKRQAVLAHIETEPSVPLLQLPPEVFDNILSKVPVWHLNRLRGVGRTMAKRTDEYTMHLVRTHLASQSPTVYERALQTVIDQLTWPLRSAGLGEFYAGAMLSLLRQNYYKPFSPCAMDVHEYVFSLCDHIRRTLSPKTFRFAYLVTLLSLMERDECAEKVSSKSNAKFGLIHIVYKLHKSWLGVLHATYPCPRSLQFPEDGPFLLVFMCDLLMFALTKQTRKEVVSTETKLFFFGNNCTAKTSSRFRFTIRGDVRSLNELEESVSTQKWTLRNANDVDYRLSAIVDIQSKEASKMGCSNQHTFEI